MNRTHAPALTLMSRAFGDAETQSVWSLDGTVRSWLAFESALAQAQARRGDIPADAAEAIVAACATFECDEELLWERTRVVGYPILPLLEQLGTHGGPLVAAYAHWGATTQDVMDTALALQSRASLDRLDATLDDLGDALAELALEHAATLVPARTHAQFAVPTTFGAKLANVLAEFTRHRDRIAELRPRLCRISMFGAGGTAAAYGPDAASLRTAVAGGLGLFDSPVSWHSARDAVAEAVWVCAAIGASGARLGREVIELSRPEIGEVHESAGHLRGASSTMPQKANPIASEVLVGNGLWAGSILSSAPMFMLPGHERAAGEWHAEWEAVPQAFGAAASSLVHAAELVRGLAVNVERMAANANDPAALLMAESAMMQLAPHLGRSRAHEAVYDACVEVKRSGRELGEVIAERGLLTADARLDTAADGYLGDAVQQARVAADTWQKGRTA